MPHKLLIVSDTHSDLSRLKLLVTQNKYDAIIHAGDFEVASSDLNKLRVIYVSGNNDIQGQELSFFEVDQWRFLIIHGHKQFSFDLNHWHNNLVNLAKKHHCNVVIYGHSHREEVSQINGIYLINPGSLTLPRNATFTPTYIEVDVSKDVINFVIKKWQ